MTNQAWEQMIHQEFEGFESRVSEAETHLGKITILEWRHPKHWNYRTVYLLFGGTLLVRGDAGEAIYEWSDRLTVDFLGGLSLSYFASKCQASDTGRGGKQWDEEVVEASLNSMLMQEPFEEKREKEKKRICELLGWKPDEKLPSIAERFAALGDKAARKIIEALEDTDEVNDVFGSEHGFWTFIDGNYADVQMLFGDPCDIGDIGMKPSGTVRRHFWGLKLAAAQLKVQVREVVNG